MLTREAVLVTNRAIAYFYHGMICPFCCHTTFRCVESLSGAELGILYEVAGRKISPAGFGLIQSDTLVEEFECDRCGGRFFDPRFGGSTRFYEEVTSAPNYYILDRPEFSYAIDVARQSGFRSVLDVGCGSGIFLDLARRANLRTIGLELNAGAGKEAMAKGHQIIGKLLETVTVNELGGPVDLVTLFHVVEHVEEPSELLTQARKLLRPGGKLVFSVPYEGGLTRLNPIDPLNWPPHHLTRWRRKDAASVLDRAGFADFRLESEPLYGRSLGPWRKQYCAQARAIGRRPAPPSDRFLELISFFYRKLGCRHFFPRWGFTLRALGVNPGVVPGT